MYRVLLQNDVNHVNCGYQHDYYTPGICLKFHKPSINLRSSTTVGVTDWSDIMTTIHTSASCTYSFVVGSGDDRVARAIRRFRRDVSPSEHFSLPATAEWVSSFLTAHQHLLRCLVPYNDDDDDDDDDVLWLMCAWKLARGQLSLAHGTWWGRYDKREDIIELRLNTNDK